MSDNEQDQQRFPLILRVPFALASLGVAKELFWNALRFSSEDPPRAAAYFALTGMIGGWNLLTAMDVWDARGRDDIERMNDVVRPPKVIRNILLSAAIPMGAAAVVSKIPPSPLEIYLQNNQATTPDPAF